MEDPAGTPVSELMARALITVNPATTALQVAKMMEQAGIGAVLVRDGGEYVGIVTDRDFATGMAAGTLGPGTPAGSFMSSPLVTAGPSTAAREAARMMRDGRIRKLAVKDGPEVVGIVTSTDIVGLIAS